MPLSEDVVVKMATTDELRAAAHDALDAWDATALPVQVAEELRLTFEVGFPLVAHAVAHVRAGLDLVETSSHVAQTCARVSLEHSLTAQWALLTVGGAETVLRRMLNSNRVHAAELLDAIKQDPGLGIHASEDELAILADLATEPPPRGPGSSYSAQEIFNRFSDSTLFYGIYRDLSGSVHPSLTTIRSYLDFGVGNEMPRLDRLGRLRSIDHAHSTAQGLGLAIVLALDFLERCQSPSPDSSLAAEIGTRVGLPTDLRFSDQRPRGVQVRHNDGPSGSWVV